MGKASGGRKEKKKRKRKAQRLNTNAIKPYRLQLHWITQFIKGYSKGSFHSKKVIHILAQDNCLFYFYFFKYEAETKSGEGKQKRNDIDFYLYGFPLLQAVLQVSDCLTWGCGSAFILIKGTSSLNMHGLEFPGWFSSLCLNVVD